MKMEKEFNPDLKDLLIGFGVIFFYLIASSFPEFLLSIFNINYYSLPLALRVIYIIFYEVLICFIIIYIYKDKIIPDFKDFIKNKKEYFDKYAKWWYLMLALMLISSIIVNQFTTTNTPNNQKDILELLNTIPIYTFLSACIIAPISEEIVFRLSIRKIFKYTNILFIIFSGLLFGSLHVIGNTNALIDYLYIIPYSIPGFIFAYMLAKSDNIFVPISFHFIHNLVMFLIQILLIFI